MIFLSPLFLSGRIGCKFPESNTVTRLTLTNIPSDCLGSPVPPLIIYPPINQSNSFIIHITSLRVRLRCWWRFFKEIVEYWNMYDYHLIVNIAKYSHCISRRTEGHEDGRTSQISRGEQRCFVFCLIADLYWLWSACRHEVRTLNTPYRETKTRSTLLLNSSPQRSGKIKTSLKVFHW